MLDRRPFWGFIICLNLCVVIWLVQDPETYVSSSSALASPTSVLATPLPSGQPSANGSISISSSSAKPKPNQIRDPSRTQRSSRRYNDSLQLSLDKAATPAPSPKASTLASTPTETQQHHPQSQSQSQSQSQEHSQSQSQSQSPSQSQSEEPNPEERLIDLHNFAYLMTQPPCGPQTLALILVHTAPLNVEKRALIRQSWGGFSAALPLRLIFLLGAVASNQTHVQQALEQENSLHGDLVQGNFQDAYRNMTYKHVMALKWFHDHCAQAQLLVKVDDDVYVNTPLLLKHLAPTSSSSSSSISISNSNSALHNLLQQPRDLLFCLPVVGSRVKRSYRSKWRVTFSEYGERYYPPYCPGFAIVYSPDVVERLYRAAQEANYFWVDDVFITGVLAKRTNTSITILKPYVLYEDDCANLLEREPELEQLEFLFSWHSITLPQISAIWQLHVAQNFTLPGGPSLATPTAEATGFS